VKTGITPQKGTKLKPIQLNGFKSVLPPVAPTFYFCLVPGLLLFLKDFAQKGVE
jgi:hypothetical protein